MPDAPILTSDDVRRIELAGRVEKDPKDHANEKGIPFRRIATALTWCHRVQKDQRSAPDGRPRHPDGYVAWCDHPGEGHLRVDFNLGFDEAGRWILVVTAIEL